MSLTPTTLYASAYGALVTVKTAQNVRPLFVPAEIRPDCSIANAVKPAGDFIVSNVYGLATYIGPNFFFVLVAVLVVMAASKSARKIIGWVLGIFVAVLLLGVFAGNLDKFFPGGC